MNIQRLSAPASSGIASKGPIQRKGETTEPADPTGTSEVSAPTQRLLAYAEKLDQRIQSAIESNKLSPRQANALQGASAQFQALMTRISKAKLGPEGPTPYFQDALKALSEKIAAIVTAGQPSQPTSIATATEVKAAPAGEVDTLA
jgi:hypothetical protein